MTRQLVDNDGHFNPAYYVCGVLSYSFTNGNEVLVFMIMHREEDPLL